MLKAHPTRKIVGWALSIVPNSLSYSTLLFQILFCLIPTLFKRLPLINGQIR